MLPLGEQEELRQSGSEGCNAKAPPGRCLPTFFLCDPLQCQQPTGKRPGNGSGPRLALARDTMRGPGQRACHKSKPVHLHTLSLRSPSGPQATSCPTRRRRRQPRCSPTHFRGEPGTQFLAPGGMPNVAEASPAERSVTPTSTTGSHAATQAGPPLSLRTIRRPARHSHCLGALRSLALRSPPSHHRNGAPERPGE